MSIPRMNSSFESRTLVRRRDDELPEFGSSLLEVGVSPYKRLRLMEARRSLTPPVDLDIPYADVGETSKIGGMLITVRDSKIPSIESTLKIGMYDSNPTRIRNYGDAEDVSLLRVVMTTKFNKVAESVFWKSDLPEIRKRNFLIARRSVANILEKMRDDGPGGEIRRRYLRENDFVDAESVTRFIVEVNARFAVNVHECHSVMSTYPGLNQMRYATYGQMLLSMFISSGHLSFEDERCGPPLRLMFLWLENWASCEHEGIRHRLLGLMYDRLFKDTCDSCFEKSLMFESNVDIMTYPYRYDSMVTSSTRYMGVRPSSSLRYEVRPHKADTLQSDSCIAWKFWEHNYLSPAYSRGTIVFEIRCVDDTFREVVVQQHLGMSLIKGLHFLQKGLKRAVFGGGNGGLVQSVRESFGRVRSIDCVKDLITDIVMLSRSCDDLRHFCHNVGTFLSLCVIPSSLVSEIPPGSPEIDFYDVLVRFLFSSNTNVAAEFIQSFETLVGYREIKSRLDDEDVMLTLSHYAN